MDRQTDRQTDRRTDGRTDDATRYLVGGNKVEEVARRDVVLSPERCHKVATDFNDRLVHVDVVLNDLLAVVARYQRVVWGNELGSDGQQRLVRPREQPVYARVVHHPGEVATSPAERK